MERNDMTIKEFAEAVVQEIYDARPGMKGTHTVEVNEVLKNNGTLLTGLTIKERSDNIAPNIYLEKPFKEFQSGMPLSEVVDHILDAYDEHKSPKNLSVDFFEDFDQAKERLAMKIVNADKNAEMLKTTPHYKFGDLAAIFQVQVDSNEFGNAVITVKDDHMKMWGVDTKTLMDHAKPNMEQNQPVRIQSMIEVLTEMMGDLPGAILPPGEEPTMYVMSNETKINGAAAMIFTDKLGEFAEEHGANLYILPSSIHEILLLPDNGAMSVSELEAMVRDVNATQVAPDEVLSDNVYYYDKDVKTIYIAATNEPCVLVSDGKDFSTPDKGKKEAIKASDKPKASESKGTIHEKLLEGKEKASKAPDIPKEIKPKDKGQVKE